MTREHGGYTGRRRPRWGVVVAVAAIHLIVVAALIRAFTPDLVRQVSRSVTEAFSVTVTTPPPAPSPEPSPEPSVAQPAGAAAPPGKKARPKPVSAPKPKVVVTKREAPPVTGTGRENAAGAAASGEGTGLQGAGSGTGAGGSGSGQGGGGAVSPPVKIAGDINSARDYPIATRDLRIGDRVVIALTVGVDGKVKSCRVARPSRDAEADSITCALATRRFRFRPATNASGQAVEAVFGWQQKWFYR